MPSFLDAASLVCAVAVALATLGIPLPESFRKQAVEWFPCLECPCGCATAEVCWRECCCFSTAEKLALAREHRVEPPQFLLAQAEREAERQLDVKLADLKPCCRARAMQQWEQAQQREPDKVACQETAGPERVTPPPSQRGVRLFSTIDALKCRGLSPSLTLLPPSVLPEVDLGIDAVHAASEQLFIEDLFFAGRTDQPPSPPPQLLG